MDKMQIIKNREELLLQVYGVTTQKEILELFRCDYSSIKNIEGTKAQIQSFAFNLFQEYLISITYLYQLTTVNNNLQSFKKIIREEGGEHQDIVNQVFHIGGGKDSKIKSIYKILSDKGDKQLEKKETINKAVADMTTIGSIKHLRILLETNSFDVASNQTLEQVRSYYLAYILGLATGRRFTEIFKTLSISTTKKGIFFKGLLKKKSDDISILEANIIELSSDEAKAYLKELQTYINNKLKKLKKGTLKTISNTQINSIFSRVYNNSIKRLTANKIQNFHELRHYYTIAGTTLFKRDGESERELRYRILGHKEELDSTRTYKTIK